MEKTASSSPLKTIPMLGGRLPLLGHAREFLRDRGALFRRGFAAHGNIFQIKLANKKGVVLCGPAYNTLFFKETDKALNMAKPYGFLKAIFGDVSFVADHETYLNQRPLVYAPFQAAKMGRYLEIMEDTVKKWLASLPDEGRLELSDAINQLVQQVAGRALVGDDFMEKAGAEFWHNYNILGKALDVFFPPNLPLPKFIRRDKARKRLMATFAPILEERRAHPEHYEDFLQDLILTRKADGSSATDQEITDLLITLLFAGHETTSGQAAWTIIQLLQHPDYLAKVKSELRDHFPVGTHINARTMVALKHIKWAIEETTRMRPSVDILIRVTDEEMNVDGFRIPKDTPVFINADTSHFMAEVFPEAEVYDPERFLPDRSEHKEHKNPIMGFGGGIHKCPGMSFAQNEMLTITAFLFQRFEVELETLDTKVRQDLGSSRPSETWIRFKRKPVPSEIPSEVMQAAAAAGCPHMAKALAAKAGLVTEEA